MNLRYVDRAIVEKIMNFLLNMPTGGMVGTKSSHTV